MAYLLGLDIGTSGAKALLIDETGRVLAAATTEYPLHTPRPFWSEQDPDDWWTASVQSLSLVLSQSGVRGGDVAGIGLTGQMHGLVLLDQHGAALRPAILWNDQRTEAECAEITNRLGFARLLELTGNAVLPGFTAPKILWVRRHEPQVYAQVARFLLPKDYLRFRLTGELASDVSDASGTSLFDVRQRTWSREMFEALQIPRDWAPRCIESSEISGGLTNEAATMIGLPAGLPVVGGAGDQAAQAIGTGLVAAGLVSATLGTSGVVFAPTARPVIEPQGRLHAFCHAAPGMWHVMGVMLAAGGSLRWLRDRLCQPEIEEAKRLGVDPYEVMTRDAATVPPGAEGLLFLPYLSGERTPHPDPHARGCFVGLTMRHTKAHLTRAVLEGVTFGLRDCLALVQAQGIQPTEVRASGGGARSALWRQIMADVFGLPVATVSSTEGAAFGAALLAGVGVGVWRDVAAACAQTIKVTDRVTPREENLERYARLYRLYRELYPALKPTFDELSS